MYHQNVFASVREKQRNQKRMIKITEEEEERNKQTMKKK
jgi:hypothetical protein